MSRASKFLSRVLRHEPDLVGLTLGPGGWVAVDDLLQGMKRAGHRPRPEELRALVAENDKRRFTLSEDGRRIRAAQGHSVAIDLDLPATPPPAELFHGTASATLDAIWAEGIVPGQAPSRASVGRCGDGNARRAAAWQAGGPAHRHRADARRRPSVLAGG